MTALTAAWAIARKDLVAELRGREAPAAMLLFGFLVVLVFNFGIEPGLREENLVRPGVYWAAFTFAGVLGLSRSFASERENDCLAGLLLSPLDRAVIYLGKLLANFIFIFTMGIIVWFFFAVLYNVDIAHAVLPFLPVLFLAAVGFSAVGTLFSAGSLGVKTRDIIFSVLLFPVVVPIVLSAAKSTGAVLDGRGLSGSGSWLLLLGVYDVIFLVVSILTFEYAVEE